MLRMSLVEGMAVRLKVSYRGSLEWNGVTAQDATRRIRDAIRQRYVLLPYIYTLFRHANTTGVPVMRPLWFDFPEESAAFAIDDEFMLGPGLLVRYLRCFSCC